MTGGPNDPHENEEPTPAEDDPANFFGGDEGEDQITEPYEGGDLHEGELPGQAAAEAGERIAVEDVQPAEVPPAAEDPAAVEEPPAEDAPVEQPPGDEPAQPEEPEPAEPGDDDDEDEASGNKRDYVVLQEVMLDADMLNDMLKAVKGGNEPYLALIEVYRAQVTTAHAAMRGAYKKHKDEWADNPPSLVPVTASKIRPRVAEPVVREVIGFKYR